MGTGCFCTLCRGRRQISLLSSIAGCGRRTFGICASARGPCSIKCIVSSGCLRRTVICDRTKGVGRTRRYFRANGGLVGPGGVSTGISIDCISKMVTCCRTSCRLTRRRLRSKLHRLGQVSRRRRISCCRTLVRFCALLTGMCRGRRLCGGTLRTTHGSLGCRAHLFSGGDGGAVRGLQARCGLGRGRQIIRRLSTVGRGGQQVGVLSTVLVILTLIAVFLLLGHCHSHRHVRRKVLRVTGLGRRRTRLLIGLRGAGLRRERQRFRSLIRRTRRHGIRCCLRNLRIREGQLTGRLRSGISGRLLTVGVGVASKADDYRRVVSALRALRTRMQNVSRSLVPPVFGCTSLSRVLRSCMCRRGRPKRARLRLLLRPRSGFSGLSRGISLRVCQVMRRTINGSLGRTRTALIGVVLIQRSGGIGLAISSGKEKFRRRTKGAKVNLAVVGRHIRGLEKALALGSTPKGKARLVIRVSLRGLRGWGESGDLFAASCMGQSGHLNGQ